MATKVANKKSLIAHAKDNIPNITSFDIGLIERAYDFGKNAHTGQKRANGDAYFTGHCVPVAAHIIELGMDANLVAAATRFTTSFFFFFYFWFICIYGDTENAQGATLVLC